MTTPASGSPKSPVASQTGLIMVVDDEEEFRINFFRTLAGTEFRAVGVACVAEALDAIKKSHPRVILLDWSLPGGINGFFLLKALKGTPATRHIPVIMTSGLPRTDSEKRDMLKVGAEGFFSKFDLMHPREHLLALLRDAIAKNKSPSKWRLLVAEDDAEVQEFIRFALARREFEVHFARTGHECCRLAQNLKPNLILLDMGLPDINGVEVCKILRANREMKGIPILAMSAMDRTAGVLESALRALGIEDYLPKPFGENELLQHMSRLFGRCSDEWTSGESLVRGRVRIEVDLRRIWVGERLIGRRRIGCKQFALLQVLMKYGDGVSREELRSLLWSGDETSNIADVTVHRLRKLLGFGETEGILSVPGGYKLVG